MAASKRGRPSWLSALTAEVDPRIAAGVAKRRGAERRPYRLSNGRLLSDCPALPIDAGRQRDYAYVLGMYLGDGYIARLKRTWALKIYMDARQVGVT
ncbi:MAG TPA: hypothetical protein VEU77_06620, partial [Candidatus Acidoferrales bacterium]|nr:hypothetical protein [Candidatus Acidoferrales bacterium]